jgi:hypothetical protein
MGAYSDQLASVQAAINAILAGGAIKRYRQADGSEVEINGLSDLLTIQAKLQTEAAAEASGSAFTLARLRPSR